MVDASVFIVSALIILGGALCVVFAKNPVHAALSLVASFFGVAVLFVLLEAHFLALVQVVVYGGAIVVLFIFVIMLLGVGGNAEGTRRVPGSLGDSKNLHAGQNANVIPHETSGASVAAGSGNSGNLHAGQKLDATSLKVEPITGQKILGVLAGFGFFAIICAGLFLSGPMGVEGASDDAGAVALTGTKNGIANSGIESVIVRTADGQVQETREIANVKLLARDIFARNVLAFEATALLLTIATVGAVVMVKNNDKELDSSLGLKTELDLAEGQS